MKFNDSLFVDFIIFSLHSYHHRQGITNGVGDIVL